PDHSRGRMDGPRATSRPVVKPTTFYFVRHGESEGNAAHVFTGQTDSPLTARGRQQAEIVADELAKVKFDRIVSSDLSRTRDTAEVIPKLHRTPGGNTSISIVHTDGKTHTVERLFATDHVSKAGPKRT